MRKNKISLECYQQIFDLYEEGHFFSSIITRLDLEIHEHTLRLKYRQYKLHGLKAIQTKSRNASYSRELKQKIVQEYLDEGISTTDLAVKYNISGDGTVRNWINRYTEGKENKSYSPNPEVYRMKKKTISYTEKLEAVDYCISRGKDYKGTAERYEVSYWRVYRWVKKFEEHGAAGLIDNRGKAKPVEVRTSEDELRLRIKALEERNNYLKNVGKIKFFMIYLLQNKIINIKMNKMFVNIINTIFLFEIKSYLFKP